MQKIDSPHSLTSDEILERLESKAEGLNEEEVQQRINQYGINRLKEQKRKSVLELIWAQVNNPVVYLLVAAATIAFVFDDIPEGIAIVVVILLNTIIGFWMEWQAEKSVESLKKLDKVTCHVRRGGETKEIDATQIVPGDILILNAGDMVPADGRILDAQEFSVDESPLTGESVPVEKDSAALEKKTSVADRKNMVFKGTAVTEGTAQVVVSSTGMQTEIGNISEMVSEADKESIPLNRKLKNLSKKLIYITVGLAAVFFALGWMAGKEPYTLFQTAIAWTIAAIPEGLPIVASIALARGMLRLADQHVVVKKLAAVETLGETTTIFTDKTGTLTENKLSVAAFASPEIEKITPDDLKQNEQFNKDIFRKISVLCNTAELSDDNADGKDKGDPLEIALLRFFEKQDKEEYDKLKRLEKVAEDPFDSDDKMMGVIHKTDQDYLVTTKGAANSIIDRCSKILDHGEVRDMKEEEINEWLKKNDEFSEDGLRVLAYAYKTMENQPNPDKDVNNEYLNDLIFAGLVGFIDPPREAALHAIDRCKQAGIDVVMVTGDHPGTSKNIARQVHIFDDKEEKAIHGDDIEGYTDEEISRTRVFARVDPSQKLDLVEHFQKTGHIAGMTGDGVNDAPALKKADIGIAMGKRGTQVAQEVADMVLKNDEFPSIVHAIEEGRIIFGNIRKFIMYQLSYHLAEILVIAAVSFSIFHLPLLPLQLLFLNLLSDVFPALALGVGKGNPNVMNQPPKSPEEPIITKQNWLQISFYGFIITLFIVASYFLSWFGFEYSKEISNNIAFFSLAFAQLLHVFNMRESHEHVFNNQVTKNKYIWYALLLCASALLAAYFIPGLKEILSFGELEPKIWLQIAITAIAPVVTIQVIKLFSKEKK